MKSGLSGNFRCITNGAVWRYGQTWLVLGSDLLSSYREESSFSIRAYSELLLNARVRFFLVFTLAPGPLDFSREGSDQIRSDQIR